MKTFILIAALLISTTAGAIRWNTRALGLYAYHTGVVETRDWAMEWDDMRDTSHGPNVDLRHYCEFEIDWEDRFIIDKDAGTVSYPKRKTVLRLQHGDECPGWIEI